MSIIKSNVKRSKGTSQCQNLYCNQLSIIAKITTNEEKMNIKEEQKENDITFFSNIEYLKIQKNALSTIAAIENHVKKDQVNDHDANNLILNSIVNAHCKIIVSTYFYLGLSDDNDLSLSEGVKRTLMHYFEAKKLELSEEEK